MNGWLQYHMPGKLLRGCWRMTDSKTNNNIIHECEIQCRSSDTQPCARMCYSYRNLATEHETLMQKYLHLLQIVETEKTVAKQLRQQIEDGEIEIERLKSEVTLIPLRSGVGTLTNTKTLHRHEHTLNRTTCPSLTTGQKHNTAWNQIYIHGYNQLN